MPLLNYLTTVTGIVALSSIVDSAHSLAADESSDLAVRSRETSAMKAVIMKFSHADTKGDSLAMWNLLDEKWKKELKNSAEFARYLDDRSAFPEVEGMRRTVVYLSEDEQFADVMLYASLGDPDEKKSKEQKVESGNKGERFLGKFILRRQNGEWRILFACPSRAQRLFDKLLEDFAQQK